MSSKSKLDSIVKRIIDPQPVIAGKARTMKSHCGKSGCKCMRKTNPEKHTYHQLSYTKDKKTKTMYVKDADLKLVHTLSENYSDLRNATLDLGHETVVLSKEYGVEAACEMMKEAFDRVKRKSIGLKPEVQKLRETRISRDKWKTKALERQAELADNAVRIRDVEKSRDSWKMKAMDAKSELKTLQKELENIKKKLKRAEQESVNKKKCQE